MSHFKERAEKNCLNCGSEVQGRFCHICGQENVEPKETVWGLVSHFFHDITHFDGKFFTSLKWLVVKPGFLSKEYIIGRRARHLNPIRMYVFTASLFFILFFSFFFDIKNLKVGTSNRKKNTKENTVIPEKVKEKALANAETKEDSAGIEEGYRYINKFADSGTAVSSNIMDEKKADTSKKNGKGSSDSTGRLKHVNNTNFNFFYNTSQYRSVAHYDSIQQSLSPEMRDGWFPRTLKRKEIVINLKIKDEGSTAVFTQWFDKFMHSFPQILFISLPLIALVLQLLYIRRKQFYYVNHGIFLIHIYIYSFINLLVFFSIGKLGTTFGWNWVAWIQFALSLHAFWYVYKAMRNFYGQRRFKTIAKFFLLNTFTLAIITFLFVLFFLFSAWNL